MDAIQASIPTLGIHYSYCDFYLKFVYSNSPCLLSESHTRTWPARIKWSENSVVNIDEVLNSFRGDELRVANCHEFDFGAHPTLKMSVEQYQAYWSNLKSESTDRLLYLKDWHYFKGKKLSDYYTPPVYFSSDWLNEFYDFRTDYTDDFRFVYVGPKGTWTPLHTDVYGSYSWSANMAGCKRWWVFPPGEEKKLVKSDGALPPDISNYEFSQTGGDSSDLPVCYIFDQQPGEIFFVPSGWYHQVLNLTDCISINNNWLNACNVDFVWRLLQLQLQKVKVSCADVKFTPDWDEACQECLKAWEGWNFIEFFLLLKYILVSRWLCLTGTQLRQRLPEPMMVADDEKARLHHLDEQVESVLSDTAKMDPCLLQWLITGTSEKWREYFVNPKLMNPVLGVREHDLVEVAKTIKDMLVNDDLKRLNLHSRGPAAWLWEAVLKRL